MTVLLLALVALPTVSPSTLKVALSFFKIVPFRSAGTLILISTSALPVLEEEVFAGVLFFRDTANLVVFADDA